MAASARWAIASGNAAYVHPAIVEMPSQTAVVHKETFAPILYVMGYKDLREAITMQNEVPQGLSSCIFSTDVRETEEFLSARRFGLRHRQCQHRPVRRRNRRRVRRREGNRRRPRVRLGRLARLHAPPDQHGELVALAAAGARHQVRDLRTKIMKSIAVLGLGKVGHLAAELLHEADFQVHGYDLRRPAHDPKFPVNILDTSSEAELGKAFAQVDAVLVVPALPSEQGRGERGAPGGDPLFRSDRRCADHQSHPGIVQDLQRSDGTAMRACSRICRHCRC